MLVTVKNAVAVDIAGLRTAIQEEHAVHECVKHQCRVHALRSGIHFIACFHAVVGVIMIVERT